MLVNWNRLHRGGDAMKFSTQDKRSVRAMGKCTSAESASLNRVAWLQVHLRARLHASRGQGKSCFLVLRQRMATVQCTIFANDADGGTVSKFMVKYSQQIQKESIVDVIGMAVAPASPIDGCTQQDVEIKVSDIHVISRCSFVIKLARRWVKFDRGVLFACLVYAIERRHSQAVATCVPIGVGNAGQLRYLLRWLMQVEHRTQSWRPQSVAKFLALWIRTCGLTCATWTCARWQARPYSSSSQPSVSVSERV